MPVQDDVVQAFDEQVQHEEERQAAMRRSERLKLKAMADVTAQADEMYDIDSGI